MIQEVLYVQCAEILSFGERAQNVVRGGHCWSAQEVGLHMGFFHIMNIYHYCTVTISPLILLLDPIISSMLHAFPMLYKLCQLSLVWNVFLAFLYLLWHGRFKHHPPSCHQAESFRASLLFCG